MPKFYRWLSERYPLVNQAIDESTLLPEVDNLYIGASPGGAAPRRVARRSRVTPPLPPSPRALGPQTLKG